MTDLRPVEFGSHVRWNGKSAAHLLRRTGFAPSPSELRAALSVGADATVERLITAVDDSARHDELDELGSALAARDDIQALRGWWLQRMCHTRRPLHARMAVFWHDHFATSNAKVRSAAMMLQQLRTFERHALGRFEDLLLAISRDPAMIVWLDGSENIKGRPNENYARELFELFGLGVGNYTETDIREAARAFTGWHQRSGCYRFSRLEHDDGEKVVFGQRGRFDGADVVRLTLQHPACARFLATKLLREFLGPQPPEPLVAELASRLRETEYDMAASLRTLLTSRAMFDPRWYRARIKSPIEFVVGIVRSLEMRAPADALATAVSQLGQRLFEPPSVKGWDDHRAWLNSATMLLRLNVANQATRTDGAIGVDPSTLCLRYGLATRADVVRFCEQLTLDGELPAVLREQFAASDDDLNPLMRRTLRVLLASPEYQMS